MRRAVALVVLLSLSVVAGATPTDPAVDGPERASNPIVATSDDFDRTRFSIRVYRNGSARWTFRYVRYLPDNESVTSFQEYAERFESEETQLYRDFEDRAVALARVGRNQTGREMVAEGFSRRAYVDRGVNDVGVVEMSFRWVAFARIEGSRVVVGDVFEGGLFLGPDQSLVVMPGPDLVFESLAPNGTLSSTTLAGSDSVTWRGEREFSDERPRIVFDANSANGDTSTAGTATTTVADGSSGGGAGTPEPTSGTGAGTTSEAAGHSSDVGLPSTALLVGALVLIVGLIGGIAYRRKVADSAETTGGATEPASSEERMDSGDAEPAVPESAILSDEERVVKLLEENGGRMRQVNIVDETDWSKSKVSMLLSDMEDVGTISKLRVGRENIVSLAGHEPDAAGSPFEDLDDDGTADSVREGDGDRR
ncbi:MAG: helix-turn-helix transcriptional regulator [archaeon]